jgi:hypothetical protein
MTRTATAGRTARQAAFRRVLGHAPGQGLPPCAGLRVIRGNNVYNNEYKTEQGKKTSAGRLDGSTVGAVA